jgi:hypothetical protein
MEVEVTSDRFRQPPPRLVTISLAINMALTALGQPA